MSKFQHIDSLRGVAILMVIATHLGPALKETPTFLTVYGRMGVQLFFVISALTLCLSMVKRLEENNPISNFFIRRYFRIAPMYILGIIIYSPLILNYTPNIEISNFAYLSHVTLLHGFTLDAFKGVVPGGWSIGVEFVFYILFPAIFVYAINKDSKKRFEALFVIFIFLSLIQNLYFQVYFPAYSSVWKYGYWSPINQLPVFMVGIMLYQNVKYNNRNVSLKRDLGSFSVLTLGSFAVWQFKPPFYVAVLPLVSALSFYYLYFIFSTVSWLNTKILRRIGQLSFSMYLLHFFSIMILLEAKFLDVFRGYSLISFFIFYLLIIGLTMFFSTITEKIIELKFVSIGREIIKRRETKTMKIRKFSKY